MIKIIFVICLNSTSTLILACIKYDVKQQSEKYVNLI